MVLFIIIVPEHLLQIDIERRSHDAFLGDDAGKKGMVGHVEGRIVALGLR